MLGGILVAHYRSTVDLPDALTGEQRLNAGETLGGAVAAARELPADVAGELLAGAGRAFGSGVSTTAGIGAVIAALAAVLVWRAVRGADR